MSTRNIKTLRYLALFVAILSFGAISSSNADAVSYDTYTDGDGVVWDRETTDDGDIYIGIKSVPSGVTTVNVPSINDVASGKDTYFLDSICSRYSTPDCSGVVSDTANVTKLDMTNTSKIQVKNVSQMFDNTHEVELVFGENMVIADPVEITISGSTYWNSESGSDPYDTNAGAFDGMRVKLTNLGNVKYIGWNAFRGTTINDSTNSITINSNQTVGGYAFAGSNIDSLTIDIAEVPQGVAKGATSLASLTLGDSVTTINARAFQDTTSLAQVFDSKNVATINAEAFKDSAITGVSFKAALKDVGVAAFKNTNLGAVSFANSGIEKIRPSAFYNAGVTSVDLGNVKWMGSEAFMGNSVTEVYFPKSMRPKADGDETYAYSQISYNLFENNPIKKVTVAFDMSTTNMTQGQSFLNILGKEAWRSTEELIVIAPYGANESVAADHDYSTVRPAWTGSPIPDEIINSAKNVLPWNAFTSADMTGDFGNTKNTKKIILDDRFEIIGTGAFNWTNINDIRTIDANGDISDDVCLPSSLKAIGTHAFEFSFDSSTDGTEAPVVVMAELPEELEYIGAASFIFDNNFILTTLDLPNLGYIGQAAFYMSTVTNIVLHDGVNFRSAGAAFMGSDQIKTVTIDFDFFSQTYLSFSDTFSNWHAGCEVHANHAGYDSWEDYYTGEIQYGNIKCGLTGDKSEQHFTKIKFTSKATTAPNANPANFMGIYVDELDFSETPWTKLHSSDVPGLFVTAKIGTLKLPSQLQGISAGAFAGAEITNPVEIPATVEEIGANAFNVDANSPLRDDITPGVKITSLPSSIKKIGSGAFYGDALFEADLNLPNLEELGFSAFQGTNVRDITLGDSLTLLGHNAFYNTPSLRNVTIDTDLYNIERQDPSIFCYMQNGEQCDGATADEQTAQFNANFYDSFVATFGDQNHKYGTITFTAKAGEPCGGFENCAHDRPYFYGIKADKVILANTNWTTTSEAMFQGSEVGEIILPHALQTIEDDTFYEAELGDVTLPTTLKTIDHEGFMRATANISTFPEGLLAINDAAFYEADVTDDLVIPSTVTHLGQSAFNAGSEDVHYDTVTIKPNLTLANTDDQLMFQLFYGSDMDKLTINSAELPATNINMADYTIAGTNNPMPEFHGLAVDEVTITALPKISQGAFEDCANLKKVDLSSDAALRAIDDQAFVRDSKMDEILFSPAIKNETVTIGEYAFEGTAFKTMGDSSKQFDLTAANFDATDGFAFSKMPKLETVDIPRNFSNKTVPEATFANDPELRLVTIDYKTETIDNAAFSNDNKLESIFIWGNTEVLDENIAGHGGGEAIGPEYGPTIPEPTDIYAYSTSPAEDYAALPVRGTFEGDFYALDEVLYLTSNKPTVLVNDDATDFDKSDLVVYAMRRDGIILESNSWATYDGNAYQRATSDIDFEAMAAAIQENPVFASIHDTPVPMDELDVTTNVNFENIGFTMVPDPDNANIRKITLLYNDKYTDHLADTDILPYQEGDPVPPVVPDTGATKAWKSFMDAGLPIVTIAMISLVGGVLIFKKRRG